MPRIVHFEIQGSDPEALARFYSGLFACKINRWGDTPYWLIETGARDQPGIDGGLLKRNGPQLLGIYLERTRSNDVHLPLFHVHALMWPSSGMTLGLCQGLAYKGIARLREEIPVEEHEARYKEAAERLATQIPELMATDTTLSRIMHLYWDFVQNNRDPAICRFPLALRP